MLEALTAWESFVGARAFGAFYAAAHVVHWLRYAWLERDYLTFSNDVCCSYCSLPDGILGEIPSPMLGIHYALDTSS